MTSTAPRRSQECSDNTAMPNAARTSKRRATYGQNAQTKTTNYVDEKTRSVRRLVDGPNKSVFNKSRDLRTFSPTVSASSQNISEAPISGGEYGDPSQVPRPAKRPRTKLSVPTKPIEKSTKQESALGSQAICNDSVIGRETHSTHVRKLDLDEFSVPDTDSENDQSGRNGPQRHRPSVLKARTVPKLQPVSQKHQFQALTSTSQTAEAVDCKASLDSSPTIVMSGSSNRTPSRPTQSAPIKIEATPVIGECGIATASDGGSPSNFGGSKPLDRPPRNAKPALIRTPSKEPHAPAHSAAVARTPKQGLHRSRHRGSSSDMTKGKSCLTPASLGISLMEISHADQSDGSPDELSATQLSNQEQTPKRHKLKDRLMSQTPLTKSTRILDSGSDSDSTGYDSNTESLGSSTISLERSQGKEAPATLIKNQANSLPMSDIAVATPGRGKVTYGRQRSHLKDQTTQPDSLLEQPLDDFAETRSTNRRTLDIFEFTAETPAGQAAWSSDSDREGPEKLLRNVHELRAAGKMRRVALETDALLDDIFSSTTLSLKRGSMIRLASKLAENDFRAGFVRDGLHSRFYALSGLRVDTCFDAAFCIGAAALLSVIPAPDLVPGNPASVLIDKFVRMLTQRSPLIQMVRGRSANMSRIQQEDFRKLVINHNERSEWQGSQKPAAAELTSCSLCLDCLAVGVRRLRQMGFRKVILNMSSMAELAAIGSGSSGDPDASLSTPLDSILATSTLEALSVAKISDTATGSDLPAAILDDVSSILLCAVQPQSSSRMFASLALRLCLNITTASSSNGRYLSKIGVIIAMTTFITVQFQQIRTEAEIEQQDSVIDNLILGLGFLTNVTENLEQSRLLFLQPAIENKPCVCSLLIVFQERYDGVLDASTENETKVNVVLGYLAVLLCCLCLNGRVREIVGTQLQDPSLEKVRNAVAQFILIHRTIGHDNDTDGTTVGGHQASFLERMETALSKLTDEIRKA